MTRTVSGIVSHGRLLILDTGIIREMVLFHAVNEYGFERLRSELRFVKEREIYEKCARFVAAFERKTTSASVVAELYHWIRDTDSAGQRMMWQRVYEEFRDTGMDEEVSRLVDMEIDLVTKFGPIDVSLMDLARFHSNENARLLTIDEGLYGKCKQAGLGVVHIYEVTGLRY